MEPITLNLDSEGSSSRRLRWLSIIYFCLGIVFFVQAILTDNAFRYVNFVLAIATILVALIYPRIYKRNDVTFDDSGITRPLKRRRLTVAWNQIAYLEASTLLFHIHTKDSDFFTIDLGNLTYEQHKTLKPKIIEFARSKGVDVRVIPG